MLKRTTVGALVLSLTVMSGASSAQTEPKPQPDPGTSEGVTDVAIRASGPDAVPLVGDTFDLIFHVSNNGPQPAPEVSFSTHLSQGLAFIAASSSDPSDSCSVETYDYPASPVEDGGGSSSSGSDAYVTCSLGEVGTSDTPTLSITVQRTGAREIYTYGSVWTSAQETNYDNGYSEIFIAPDKTRMADVGISMSGPKGDVSGEFSYTIEVTNQGPTDATSASVVDYIPDGVDAISFTSSDATDVCTISDGGGGPEPAQPSDGGTEPAFYRQEVGICNLGTLPVGGSETLTLRVSRTSGWEIWNSAYATTSSYDPNYENDYTSFQIGADPSVTSDVSVSIATTKGITLVGDKARFIFSVSNKGPSTAGDLFLTNFLPEGLEFVSYETQRAEDSCSFDDYSYKDQAPFTEEPGTPESSAPSDSSFPVYYGGSSFSCSLSSMGSGDSTSVTLVVKRTTAREIYEYVSIYSSNYDPHYEDNYAEVQMVADKSNPADVSVSITAPEDPEVGSSFDYDITVTNEGPATASGVTLSDPLPWGVDFVGATSSDGNDVCEFSDYSGYDEPREMQSSPSFYGYRELRCDLGDMAPGESTEVTLSVTRTSEYEIWNSAYVTSRSYDENYENDYAYVGSTGERAYGCAGGTKGTDGSDEIVVDDCPVESGAGADQIEVFTGSASGDRQIATGRGADRITVNIPSGSDVERFIEVAAGRGTDTINVVVGPGATNATVYVRGGSQADSLNLDIAPTAGVIRIVFKGGEGADTAHSLRYAQTLRTSSVRMLGGPGRDVLMGTNSSDLLSGGRGEDVLDGGSGDDTLDGGKAVDVCRDGPGDDLLVRC